MKFTKEFKQKLKEIESAKRNIYKVVQVADLENFEVFAYVPCYRSLTIAAPDYFIDLTTGEKLDQEIRLAIYPDGSLEQSHYAIYSVAEGRQFPVTTEEIPYTLYYRETYLSNSL